jgi:hypothetical protein
MTPKHDGKGDAPMTTVTITETKSGFANQPSSYQVGDHYDDTTHLSCLPVTYDLPPGYRVAESNRGTMEIYDSSGAHCEIVRHSSGLLQLMSSQRGAVLKPVAQKGGDQ